MMQPMVTPPTEMLVRTTEVVESKQIRCQTQQNTDIVSDVGSRVISLGVVLKVVEVPASIVAKKGM